MKFSVLQENLSKGISIVSRAIPAKAALPILSNVLIATDDGKLKLAATNMETTIITNVGASIDSDGAITIPAKLLKDFVTNLSPGTIKAELKNDILHLQSEKTKSKINGINAEDFPELPNASKIKSFLEFDPSEFNKIISLVTFSSGADESRPVFTGVLIKKINDKITFASTDGFRLSEINITLKSKYPDFSTIIPSKTLSEISRIFSNSTGRIKFALNENENLAIFANEDIYVATRILDGEFPDYTRIIPSASVLNVNIPFEDFAEAVRLTKIFSSEDDSALVIKFNPDGNIKITSLAEITGEHESNILAEVEGDSLEVAFGTKYLMDFLNNIKSDFISFSTNGNVSPCVFKTQDHKEYLHIIMPRQI